MAERKGLNRQTILDAAVQLVEEEGLPALSLQAVSYTHLDVYKRQRLAMSSSSPLMTAMSFFGDFKMAR